VGIWRQRNATRTSRTVKVGGLATRAVRVGCLALVVGALAGRAAVAQPVVETRLLAGVHFIEMLTAGAKTQERQSSFHLHR
jgi:hypothetical protein